MKKVIQITALLLACVSATTDVSAARLFVLFEPGCMDRLVYSLPESRTDFVTYQVNVSPGEKLVLEIGAESTEIRTALPSPMVNCNTGVFDQKMMNKINSNLDEVFVVYPVATGQYFISRVASSAYHRVYEQQLTHLSPRYRFLLDLERGTIGENISYNNTSASVFFDGTINNDCSGEYLFRQIASTASNAYTGLVVAPEIGIVEERSGTNIDMALLNTRKLKSVNGLPYAQYMRKICGQAPPATQPRPGEMTLTDVPSGYDVTATLPFQPGNTMTSKTVVLQPTAAAAASRTHQVAKGETLYAISRKYNVKVSDLKAWNNLKGSDIRNGQTLLLDAATPSPSTPAAAPANTMAAKGEQVPNTAATHTVTAGETVAYLAMKYGYTEQRFRQFNNLGSSEVLRPGQWVKTSDCPPAGSAAATPSPRNFQVDTPVMTLTGPTAPAPAAGQFVPRSVEPAPYDRGGDRIQTATQPSAPSTAAAASYNQYIISQPSLRTSTATAVNRPSSQDPGPAITGELQFYDTPITGTDYTRGADRVSYGVAQPTVLDATPSRDMGGFKPYNPTPVNTMPFQPAATSQPVYDRQSQSYRAVPDNNNAATALPAPSLPAGETQSLYHVVREGETLYSIARQHSMKVDQIRSLNNMTVDQTIYPFQKLLVR